MLKRTILGTIVLLGVGFLTLPARAQSYTSEAAALRFCRQGNVIWYDTASRIYYENGSRHYGERKGGYTCRHIAERSGSPVRLVRHGRLAQRESASFTPKRSQVRSLHRPHQLQQVSSLSTIFVGRLFPRVGAICEWFGIRTAVMSR